jgi:hypothetical protein
MKNGSVRSGAPADGQAGELPAQLPAVAREPRPGHDVEPETGRGGRHVVRPHRPAAAGAPARHVGDPGAERVLSRHRGFDHGDQLEVRRTQGHDPVRRAPGRMVTAGQRDEPVVGQQPGRGDLEVGDADDDVVDLELLGRHRALCRQDFVSELPEPNRARHFSRRASSAENRASALVVFFSP